MVLQLKVFVLPHPLIQHWLTVARDKYTPFPLFRTALQELSRWLTYEAIRDWLPTQTIEVETPLAVTTGKIIPSQVPLAIVPILRAGLALLEPCQSLIPGARVYHLGMVRDEETLLPSCYLDRLPSVIEPTTRLLILEPMLATGGTIMQVLEMLTARGADPQLMRIISIICAPPALQKLSNRYPHLQVFAAAIDESLNDKGFIIPGLGDAGDRAFGT
ncbi:MAG: uracil phosphoribosyltransferase [Pseudanabaenaceae cyanobacterium SKYGB_i_bin29]|nr:uracil phosphoribosyltransferase [Pseudanabaenaceae cyanobacterium SKYG29]MDW8420490.1 uracil phosphoribosyltransferase [Pseudanabaenaceae cyanobacterium SKYGB_i_bin29]